MGRFGDNNVILLTIGPRSAHPQRELGLIMRIMRQFDLVIIGSGSGNTIVDDRFGHWDVAFVDRGVGSRGSYGGTCLNMGRIPGKTFVHTADVAHLPGDAARLGVDLALRGADWPTIRDRIFGRIDPLADAGEAYRREGRPNTTLFAGTARFTGRKQLTVTPVSGGGEEEIAAEHVVVAAGSRPAVPDLPGLMETGSHTSDSVMRLETLPSSMVILGSGFIAAELAHLFSALGVRVTVVARSDRLLRREDDDVSRRFTDLAAARWDVRLRRRALRAERHGALARLFLEGPGGLEIAEGEVLLVATGRVPNSDVVDAAAGGLAMTKDGRIRVDTTQAASVDGVWALGDISSPYLLKHVANREARTVQHNLLHPYALARTDHRFVPHAVFTSPKIASVGLTEQEAKQRGVSYVKAVQEYADIAYCWTMEDTTGFAKILADPATGALLGAHIIGAEAPTLIQPVVQAMHFGLDARSMAVSQYWIHPAMPELVENTLLALPLH
jgi:mycothione reductase